MRRLVAVGVVWSLMSTTGCRATRAQSLQDLQPVNSYDLAAEWTARKAASGTWQKQFPQFDGPPTLASQAMSGQYDQATYRIRSVTVAYDADQGTLTTEQRAVNRGQRSPSAPTYFVVRTIGTADTNSSKFTYLNNFGEDIAKPNKALICSIALASGLFTVPMAAILISASVDQAKQRAVIKGGKLDAEAMLSLSFVKTMELADLVHAVADDKPELAYLNTIVDRKLRQDDLRQKLATLLEQQDSVKPMNVYQQGKLLDGSSFLATYQVDLNSIPAKGADVLALSLPSGLYKMRIYPQMVVEIAMQSPGADKGRDWSFRNTFTRTSLVDPDAGPCKESCFSSDAKRDQWESHNLKKFNYAFAKMVSLLPANELVKMTALTDVITAMRLSLADVVAPPTLAEATTGDLTLDQAVDDPADDAKELDRIDPVAMSDDRDLAAGADPDASHVAQGLSGADASVSDSSSASSSSGDVDAQPASADVRGSGAASDGAKR